ncbi:NADH-cytochrome b5 reductase 2 [Trichinella spiralis]|uniref:NADH-cytochrome b5 reductase 2 n=1 Tax=Trichinella spiralis TaxID=6334 RepID=UPI0001EFD2E3|nr:NADH-cytochrome b5 reductase 2 [Trichinella spiralis]
MGFIFSDRTVVRSPCWRLEWSKERFFGYNSQCFYVMFFLTDNCTTMLNANWITTAALLAGVGLASAAVYYYAFIKRKPKKLLEDPTVNYGIVLASKEVCENLNKVNHDTRMFRFSLHSADQVLGLGVVTMKVLMMTVMTL